MASCHAPNIKGYLAAEDLSAKQYYFVKLSTDDKHVALCGANERAIGVLMNAPESGQGAEVALIGGGALLKINETVTIGKLLTSTSGGLGEVSDAAGEWSAALALEGGSANDVISVMVIAMQAVASDA